MDSRAKANRDALNQQVAMFGKIFPGSTIVDTGKEVVITIPKPQDLQEEKLFDD